MKELYGKDLAKEILKDVAEKTKKLEYEHTIHITCSNRNNPYYKGIVRDADRCSFYIDNGQFNRHTMCGTISLDPYHVPYPKHDLDGGYMIPCTAEAIMELLRYYNIPLAGKNVLIIGRSHRVGRPLVGLMLDADATVTCCHSKTSNLHWNMMTKDIIISCVGGAGFDGSGVIDRNTIVIDVGGDFINYGDADWLVPYIGGVGPVTRAVLMRHAYEKALEKERDLK